MPANLTASQIAAQAAMQHQASSQNTRKRSQTVPRPQSPQDTATGRRKPTPIQASGDTGRLSPGYPQYQNGLVGGHMAAASAANAAFPRSGQLSPGLTNFEGPVEKEHKLKSEKSKIKLFSKPKQLGLSSVKDFDQKDKPLPSPNNIGLSGPSGLSKLVNPSMTSLADSVAPGQSGFYSSANVSTSTLVPTDKQHEKEKGHKHHFLSRQKNKLKDKKEEYVHPLSSTSTNSKPLESNAPQPPLHSFAPLPASPGLSATSFAKSVSGLDFRHGGRALREKKKEEKASAAQTPVDKRPDTERADRALSTSFGSLATQSFLGPTGSVGVSAFGGMSSVHATELSNAQIGLQGVGLPNMSPEDAWDYLKAKLLIIFEGEELRMAVEDLNRLVSVHIQRCIQKRLPTIIIEDLRDLLQTGFLSLDQTIRAAPDHRLVTRLVEMWLFVFGTVLPYMQAVFLPLDLEFKGHGPLMKPSEAAEFWSANSEASDDAFGDQLDVRSVVLLAYRDHVILPRHDSLKAIFSRLSLDSINATVSLVNSSPDLGSFGRPGTAASVDPAFGSFNSQGSTLLGEGGRSRAASNLSTELPPFAPSPRTLRPPPQQDSSQVTETVGRMLQCVSVLASLQSGDESQAKMEGLAKALKLNWLGRGRTGRNRKGFVGTRVAAVRQRSSQGTIEQADQIRRESML